MQFLNESTADGRQLRISHLGSEPFQATRGIFIDLLIEADYFSTNNRTKSTAFHAPSFYLIGEQWLEVMHDLHDEFNKLMKPSFPVFMSDSLAKVPDEERSIKQVYLNHIQSFG